MKKNYLNSLRKVVEDWVAAYYSIEEIYNCHHDTADEILMKSIIYTQKLIKNHLKIDGLFPDKKTYLRYLFSNYINESEIHNRPLSKFTQDLLKLFKII